MSVTNWKYPGSATTITDGSADWSNPTYIEANDTNYASAAITKGAPTKYLTGTNFGFSSSDIPQGSTIDGLEISVVRYEATGLASDLHAYLTKNGSSVVGSNLASVNLWPIYMTEQLYGGGTNLCGATWSQSEIVANTFGFMLSVTNNFGGSMTPYVNYFKIRIYYTGGGGGVSIPVLLCALGEY